MLWKDAAGREGVFKVVDTVGSKECFLHVDVEVVGTDSFKDFCNFLDVRGKVRFGVYKDVVHVYNDAVNIAKDVGDARLKDVGGWHDSLW